MARHLPSPRSTLLYSSLFYLSFSVSALAFNPDDGVAADAPPGSLPSTRALTGLSATNDAPLYTPGMVKADRGYISPLAPIQMPARPLYPTRTGTTVSTAAPTTPMPVAAMPAVTPAPLQTTATPAPTMPALPPVDPAVAAKAQTILAAQTQSAPAPMQVAQPLAAPASGFIAPAPVLATTPMPAPAVTKPVTYNPPAAAQVQPAITAPAVRGPVVVAKPEPTMAPAPVAAVAVARPAVTPIPVVAAPVAATVVALPSPELSDETRTILSHVPAALDAPRRESAKISLDRVSPEIDAVLGAKAQEDSYEAVGLSIKVRRPGLDTNYELNRAYTALMGGDTQTAIQTYKNILAVEPSNQEGLFGLAATYHRLGMTEKARPLYGMLLKVNPNHREGLNNFLVMVTDESPQDALPELERLEARNPDFSPIPAQLAMVLEKLGYPDQAREKMLRAIELSPDNLTYKYNLAIMLDRQGQTADAIALYRSLVKASLHGAPVPASLDAMQQRLNYLVTELTKARTAAMGAAIR